MNLSVKDGGLPPASVVQDEDTVLADCTSQMVLASGHCRTLEIESAGVDVDRLRWEHGAAAKLFLNN